METCSKEKTDLPDGVVRVELEPDEIANLISRALDSNQGATGDIVVRILHQYDTKAKKLQKDKAGKVPPDEFGRLLSEELARCISQGVIDAFGQGFNSGLTTAFDIVDAKMRGMLGIPETPN